MLNRSVHLFFPRCIWNVTSFLAQDSYFRTNQQALRITAHSRAMTHVRCRSSCCWLLRLTGENLIGSFLKCDRLKVSAVILQAAPFPNLLCALLIKQKREQNPSELGNVLSGASGHFKTARFGLMRAAECAKPVTCAQRRAFYKGPCCAAAPLTSSTLHLRVSQ